MKIPYINRSNPVDPAGDQEIGQIVSIFKLSGSERVYSQQWLELAKDLKRDFLEGNLVLLLGSGISRFAPSNVPMGSTISRCVRAEMLNLLPAEDRSIIDYLTHNLPFEALMSRATEVTEGAARKFIRELTELDGGPNHIHNQVAFLVVWAKIANIPLTVITTNYDLGISTSIDRMAVLTTPSENIMVIRENDSYHSGDQIIFHIHGATNDMSSFVVDYNAEFRLERWKKKLLRGRLQGKMLLVIGYSGEDLDVSYALASIHLKELIWVRSNYARCSFDQWSVAAQDLATAVGLANTVALNVDKEMSEVLAPLMPLEPEEFGKKIAGVIGPLIPVGPRELDSSKEEHRFPKVLDRFSDNEHPFLVLWARWMGVRAGYGKLAHGITENECLLMDRAARLEIESFGDYYSARHKRGAEKQRAAADCVKHDVHRYLYHRNNEVEFYQRGGYTLLPLKAIASSLIHATYLETRQGRFPTTLRHPEARNIIASLPVTWPFTSLFVGAQSLQRLLRSVAWMFGMITREGDLDKFSLMQLAAAPPGSKEFYRAEKRFDWLGQRARLINIYRVGALRVLLRNSEKVDKRELGRNFQRVYLSAQWAALIGDPCRLGKSWLTCIEASNALRSRYAASWSDEFITARDGFLGQLSQTLQNSIVPKNLHLEGDMAEAANLAWAAIGQAEISDRYTQLARFLYGMGQSRHGRTGDILRLMAISLLETM